MDTQINVTCYSSGFALREKDDNTVNYDGKHIELSCGTEKGKHKCKKDRTAGESC